jgi:NAD(P)-dependent dehydrogenase (short-subunit alcohol dehydrogenase family)
MAVLTLASSSSLASDGSHRIGAMRTVVASDEPDVLAVKGDITQADTARRVVQQTLERFGRIDSLVNNAGIYIEKPFTEYTLDDYAAITGVNVTGFFNITRPVIGQMISQGGGHVVNISTSLVDHAHSERPSALASLTKGAICLERATFVTGEVLHIDGGQIAGH